MCAIAKFQGLGRLGVVEFGGLKAAASELESRV